MLFHIERYGRTIGGWLTPDNPADTPKVQIIRPDGKTVELESNAVRPDLVEVKLHPTGKAGFGIDRKIIPDLDDIIDQIEIRDAATGITLYRPYDPAQHVAGRIFRLELQAMPYAAIESAWSRNFSLYYNAVERYPFETFFGILNNPVSKSLALSGRPSLHRYEQLFRDREYKFVTLLRDPFEELAERLLFVRYTLSPNAPADFQHHLTGLADLRAVTQRMDLSNFDTFLEAFSYLSDRQMDDLSNPLVRALACNVEDPEPRPHHVELALNRLATFDLVGTRPNFGAYKSGLSELLGRDILGGEEMINIDLVLKIADELKNVKLARALVALDAELYKFASKAVIRAIDTAALSRSEEQDAQPA